MLKILGIIHLMNKELKYRKNKFKFFMISVSMGIISMMLFITLSDGVVTYLQEMLNQNSEYKEITVSSYSEEESRKILKLVNTIPYVNEVCEFIELCWETDLFKLGETEYVPPVVIIGLNIVEDDFEKNEEDFKKIIVCGRGFRKGEKNKAIIDEYALLVLGVKDYNDILGKKVTIQREGRKVECEIIGVHTIDISVDKQVVDSQFYDDADNRSYDDAGRGYIGAVPVILTYEDAKQLRNKGDEQISYIKLSLDSVYHTEQVYEQLDAANITVFAEIAYINRAIEDINFVGEILYMSALILLILAIVNMLNAEHSVISDNKKWYYMLKIIGYRKNQIAGIVSAEMAVLTLKALIISGIIMYGIIALLNIVIFNLFEVADMFSYPLTASLKLALSLMVSVVVLSSVLTFFTLTKKSDYIEYN